MIRYVLFDLDNTLYPSDAGMEEDTIRRIAEYSASYLGVAAEQALKLRKERMHLYGTTLEWLMAERGLTDVDAYYAYIHPDGEEENLVPDPAVRDFIAKLPVPASVLTNAPMEHAERVLKKLELEGLFEHVFDIRWNNLKGKPAESAFRGVLSAVGSEPEETLFVDDLPQYLEGFIRIGGFGVLIDDFDRHAASPYPRVRSIPELGRFLGPEAGTRR
jgi:putative hydrolase of the HAD superfamily